MFRAVILLFLVAVLLAALAVISCLSVENKSRIRHLPRFAWMLVILLVPLAGPAAWFLSGRPESAARGSRTGWPLGGRAAEPKRPTAPDDDPDFLRSLDQPTISKQEEELLRQWEEDLRRREDDQRRRDLDN